MNIINEQSFNGKFDSNERVTEKSQIDSKPQNKMKKEFFKTMYKPEENSTFGSRIEKNKN